MVIGIFFFKVREEPNTMYTAQLETNNTKTTNNHHYGKN